MKVFDDVNSGGDGASNGVSTAPIYQDLPPNHNLLVGELELNTHGIDQGVKGTGHKGKGYIAADVELHITKAKRLNSEERQCLPGNGRQ